MPFFFRFHLISDARSEVWRQKHLVCLKNPLKRICGDHARNDVSHGTIRWNYLCGKNLASRSWHKRRIMYWRVSGLWVRDKMVKSTHTLKDYKTLVKLIIELCEKGANESAKIIVTQWTSLLLLQMGDMLPTWKCWIWLSITRKRTRNELGPD